VPVPILGLMFEAVTGQPVDEVVTDVALQAGLTQTALTPRAENDMPDPSSHGYIDPLAVGSLEALGATVEEGTDVTDWSLSWGGAGGGMYSVIRELFTWTSTAMGNNLLSTELGEQRLALETEMADEGLKYGLGIFQLASADGWVGHTGQAIGWEAMGFYNLDTGATICVMVNATSGLSPFYGAWAELFGVTLA
jgi:D-alanyl-D-alanine carboxypeptidase